MAQLPTRSEFDALASTFHCVERMRKWHRFRYGMEEMSEIALTMGCSDFERLDDEGLNDLVGVLAASFEEALDRLRRLR